MNSSKEHILTVTSSKFLESSYDYYVEFVDSLGEKGFGFFRDDKVVGKEYSGRFIQYNGAIGAWKVELDSIQDPPVPEKTEEKPSTKPATRSGKTNRTKKNTSTRERTEQQTPSSNKKKRRSQAKSWRNALEGIKLRRTSLTAKCDCCCQEFTKYGYKASDQDLFFCKECHDKIYPKPIPGRPRMRLIYTPMGGQPKRR